MLKNCFKNFATVLKRSCILFVLLTISVFVLKKSITIVDINNFEIVINTSFDFESEVEKEVNLDDDYLHGLNFNFSFENIFSSKISLPKECMLCDFSREDPTPPPELMTI